jgi:hypothetical protein
MQRTRDASNEAETPKCPAKCIGCNMTTLSSNPDPANLFVVNLKIIISSTSNWTARGILLNWLPQSSR